MQAVIITAYKDKEQLLRLVSYFRDKVRLFIHIDAKSTDLEEEDVLNLGLKNISVCKKYRISWGSWYHLKIVNELLERACSYGDVTYIHTLSGQDLPVVPLEDFLLRFNNEHRIYSEFVAVTRDGIEEFLYRLHYPFPSTIESLDSRWVQGIERRLLHLFMRMLRIKRNRMGRYSDIYKGLIWFSIPIEVAKYTVQQWKKDDKFIFAAKHTWIPEELFFQTIWMNSEFADLCTSDSIRYMDWRLVAGEGVPRYMQEEHIPIVERQMRECGACFARKVDSRLSKVFIDYFRHIADYR